MTKEQLGHFRTLLERAREQANRRIHQEQDQAQGTNLDNAGEIGDVSPLDAPTDTALALGQQNTAAFNEIDLALLRLDRGEYGVCEECGAEIEVQRLEVQPAARTCAPCAEIRERGRDHQPTL